MMYLVVQELEEDDKSGPLANRSMFYQFGCNQLCEIPKEGNSAACKLTLEPRCRLSNNGVEAAALPSKCSPLVD